MDEKKAFRKNPDMVARRIDDETILVPIFKTSEDINYIYSLNKSAQAVWAMIDGKRTKGKIKKMVLSKFDTEPEKAEEKLGTLLKDLKKIKAIK